MVCSLVLSLLGLAFQGESAPFQGPRFSVEIGPLGPLTAVSESLETVDGPRVELRAATGPGIGFHEWMGLSYDGPAGHVEAVATGSAADWAEPARVRLEPVSLLHTAHEVTAVARVGDLRVETRYWFDDDGERLVGNVKLINLGPGTLSNVFMTREYAAGGGEEAWSFPSDFMMVQPLGRGIRRHVWMFDNIAPGGSTGGGFSFRPVGADPARASSDAGVEVPLSAFTSPNWPQGFVIQGTNGVSFGDYDGDGWPDLFAAFGATIYRNLNGVDWGTGLSVLNLLGPTEIRYGSSFGDFDGDGMDEVATEPRKLFGLGGDECMHVLDEQGGSIVDLAVDPVVFPFQACAADSETICWGDVDGDRQMDFFLPTYPPWVTIDGPGNFFYYNQGPVAPGGKYTFTEMAIPSGLWNPPATARPEGAQFVDTDSDGDFDLVCNGTLYINESTAGAPFFDALLTEDSGFQFWDELEEGLIFFDYDLDGDFDLAGVWTDADIGVRIHENKGDGSFQLLPADLIDSHTTGLNLGISAADWDGDGDIDFTTRQVFRRNNLIEQGDGANFTVASTNIPPSQLVSATPAWADWDRDGDLDSAIGDWLSDGNFFTNDLYGPGTPLAAKRYLRVRPVRDSQQIPTGVETEFGASVEVDVVGDAHRRRLFTSSSGGYLNQNEYALTFFLPPDPTPADPTSDVVFDLSADFPEDESLGYRRVDRHVNPVLGGIDLAALSNREISIFRSGRVLIDGCVFEPTPTSSTLLTTTTDGLVRPASDAPVPPVTGTLETDRFVGIEVSTAGTAAPVRVTELILDGQLRLANACGTPWNVAFWDVTSTPTLVSSGALDLTTDPRNNRSYFKVDVLLAPERTYRVVAHVSGFRATSVFAPFPTGPVTVTGGLAYQDSDPCSGTAMAAAPTDFERVYLALRLRTETGNGWTDLGGGLAGAAGIPLLTGTGPQDPGQPFGATLSGAAPNASVVFVLGLTLDCTPFFGGTVFPALDQIVGGAITDANGDLSVASNWPAVFTPGDALFLQAGVVDLGAPAGLALSNAVVGVTQP